MEEAKSSREPSRARSLLKPVFCLVSAFLALFFILLATSSIAELDIGRLLPFRPSGDSCDCRNQQQQWEDYRSRTVNFTEHIKYKSLNRDFDVVWDQLLPSNGGFIMFRDQDNKKHKYGMSMFHQLHCLSMLRMAMQEFDNAANGAATATPAPEHHHHQRRDQQGSQETPDAPHWLHCFDYLRQVRVHLVRASLSHLRFPSLSGNSRQTRACLRAAWLKGSRELTSR